MNDLSQRDIRIYKFTDFDFPPAAESEDIPMPRKVAGILLTGGVGIAPQLIDAADRAHIPVIVVKEDAFATMERLERGSSSISHRDTAKLDHFTRLMERNQAFDRLFLSLNIVP